MYLFNLSVYFFLSINMYLYLLYLFISIYLATSEFIYLSIDLRICLFVCIYLFLKGLIVSFQLKRCRLARTKKEEAYIPRENFTMHFFQIIVVRVGKTKLFAISPNTWENFLESTTKLCNLVYRHNSMICFFKYQ